MLVMATLLVSTMWLRYMNMPWYVFVVISIADGCSCSCVADVVVAAADTSQVKSHHPYCGTDLCFINS